MYPANSTHALSFYAAATLSMTCRQTHATPRAVDKCPASPPPSSTPTLCLFPVGAASSQRTTRSRHVTSDVVQPCPLFPGAYYYPFLPRLVNTLRFPRCETRPRPRLFPPTPPLLVPGPAPPSFWLPQLLWQPPSGAIRAYIYLVEPRPLAVMSAMAFLVGHKITAGFIIYLYIFFSF